MTPQSSRTRRRTGAHHFNTQSLRDGEPGCCIVPGESGARVAQRSPEKAADPGRITALRRELADAERALRARALREAERLAVAERIALRDACDACHRYDRIRRNANARLDALRAGGPERFPQEQQIAETVLRQADRADAAFTVIAFAKWSDRLRYLRGGSEREAVILEALECGGVYTGGCGGKHFREIVR